MIDTSGLVHIRCNEGRPCSEVVLRLQAVDRARELEDVPSDFWALDRMRRMAEQFAEAHHHGMTVGRNEEQ